MYLGKRGSKWGCVWIAVWIILFLYQYVISVQLRHRSGAAIDPSSKSGSSRSTAIYLVRSKPCMLWGAGWWAAAVWLPLSPAGHTQLRPRWLWDHHPLGLCHGRSPAAREHPAREAAAPVPPVSCLLSWDYCDSSSLEITAKRSKQHWCTWAVDTPAGFADASSCLVFGLLPVLLLPFARRPNFLHRGLAQPTQRKCFKTWTNYLWQSALLSQGSVCKGQVEFSWSLGSPAVYLHAETGSESELVPCEVSTGCSDTQHVIGFASCPQEAKAP